MKNNILMRHLRLIGLHPGKNVDEFEKELAAKVGIKAAAALSSGTAAFIWR